MAQLSLNKIFASQRETQVISEPVSTYGTGGEQAQATKYPRQGTSRGLREAKQIWNNVKIATYSCEHLSEIRLIQITREMELNNVKILCLQGTRSKYGGDRLLNGYKMFYEPVGDHKLESYAGVAVIMSLSLLENVMHKNVLVGRAHYGTSS